MTTRFAIALTLIVAFVSVASAKKSSVDIDNARESVGFNALDHVLQKPLGNPSFPEDNKGFGNHLYFGFNAGGSYINNNLSGDVRPGFNFGAHIGGWFTPVHGLRLTGVGGRHSVHSSSKYDAWYGSIEADYMMNLSSLLYGYDPNRKFELIGGAGLFYQRTTQHGHAGNNYGAAASLQMRFNLPNSFYLFVEPEINVTAGKRYDPGYSWYRMYTDIGLNVGFGYRILTGKERKAGSTIFTQKPEDNIFYGLSGGVFGLARSGMKLDNPVGSIFIGKMFSPSSGIQFTGNFGKYRHERVALNRFTAIGTADYVLNMTNAFTGYHPDNLFHLYLNAGPSFAMVSEHPKLYAGFHLGLSGEFRLSHNWGLFINPQLYNFAEGYTKAIGAASHPIIACNVGVKYTVGDFSRRYNAHLAPGDSTQRWFFNVGVGGGLRFRPGRTAMIDGYIGVGRRFTPVSSWRLNIGGEHFSDYNRLTAGIDYMSSISTAMYGYREDRFFDLQTVAGLFVGGAKFEESMTKPTFGAKAGVEANFRLTKDLSVYLEPNVLAVYGPTKKNNMYWTPELRMQVGLKYSW